MIWCYSLPCIITHCNILCRQDDISYLPSVDFGLRPPRNVVKKNVPVGRKHLNIVNKVSPNFLSIFSAELRKFNRVADA